MLRQVFQSSKYPPARQLRSVALRYARQSAKKFQETPGRTDDDRLREPIKSGDSVEEKLRRVQAVLLLAREPLTSRKLSQYANLADGTEARTLIRRLNKECERQAFCIEQAAGGYQLRTRPQFAPWLRRLPHLPAELRLSSPGLETLAVVAYRQPVLRATIEAIRGVSCGEILRQLLDRDLVRIAGRSSELGRPFLYATTRYFLTMFGLRSLEELPSLGCGQSDQTLLTTMRKSEESP